MLDTGQTLVRLQILRDVQFAARQIGAGAILYIRER